MLIVVTGCAGYVGSVLCQELLSRGHDVYGIDSLHYGNHQSLLHLLSHPAFTFEMADVREYDWHIDADAIIPLAAMVGAPICDKSPLYAKEVNQTAIEKMMKCLKPWHKVIFPNTNSGYGQTTGDEFVTEESEMSPISVYGVTKCAAEKAVLEHPRSAVFRLATVFGASPRMRMDLMVNDFTAKLVEARDTIDAIAQTSCTPENAVRFEIFDPQFKRNFVHVNDVVRAFIFAIERDLTGVYNLGLPTANLTKMQLAEFICEQLGVSRDILKVGNGKDPDQRNYLVSNDKILSTGFCFENDLAKGIQEVVQICKMASRSELKKMRNV